MLEESALTTFSLLCTYSPPSIVTSLCWLENSKKVLLLTLNVSKCCLPSLSVLAPVDAPSKRVKRKKSLILTNHSKNPVSTVFCKEKWIKECKLGVVLIGLAQSGDRLGLAAASSSSSVVIVVLLFAFKWESATAAAGTSEETLAQWGRENQSIHLVS